jgi:hypothetical protein
MDRYLLDTADCGSLSCKAYVPPNAKFTSSVAKCVLSDEVDPNYGPDFIRCR